ncbi:hypothetical protein M1513_00585 [Patescibacteria group bacterium]|nr:hypothetical protein [Patescibacteria group bacterium]MCL5733527.1 hypothetical protein [Patescibacteria group bacterium]
MGDLNVQAAPSSVQPTEKLSIAGESDLRYIERPIGSIFVGIIVRRGNKVFIISEDKKPEPRLIGGKVDKQDDQKGVLPALGEKGIAGVNYQDLIAIIRVAIKRETLEESGNVIDVERVKFAYARLGDDEKNPGKLHLQIFFDYKLKENEEWKFNPQQPPSEEEKVVKYSWVSIGYDNETKRISLDPYVKVTFSHFKALLQFARNR